MAGEYPAILKAVASVLKVKESRVVVRTDYVELDQSFSHFTHSNPSLTTTSGGRKIQADVSSFLELLILPDPEDPSQINPLQRANSLNDYRMKLKESLPTLDETY
jgi:hypothetical protein